MIRLAFDASPGSGRRSSDSTEGLDHHSAAPTPGPAEGVQLKLLDAPPEIAQLQLAFYDQVYKRWQGPDPGEDFADFERRMNWLHQRLRLMTEAIRELLDAELEAYGVARSKRLYRARRRAERALRAPRVKQQRGRSLNP